MSNRTLGEVSRRPRILCVDDEHNVLEGLVAFLRRRFRVLTASDGAAGLLLIAEKGPFEVVLSDMQMPDMDGATFLSEVRRSAPDTTRLLLTGHAAVPAAVKAVNEGGIFRFLTKPCPPSQLLEAVEEGCRQYQLRIAERQLLEQTLKGAVSVLSEVMALASPVAFGRANRIQRTVRWVVREMGLEHPWRYELAAMLSQIGLVGVEESVLVRAAQGLELDAEERRDIEEHPEIARRLLARIPRLESVSRMIANQTRDTSPVASQRALKRNDAEALGGHILRAALDLDQQLVAGEEPMIALRNLRRVRNVYNPAVLEAMQSVYRERSRPTEMVTIDELMSGMILLEPIRTIGGVVVVPQGYEISAPIKARLMRFAKGRGVKEPIHVQMPALGDGEELATAEQLVAMG
ncbi:MAG TPA: response regulator [Deltaproteobacteria bacterium]|nr:response regulator [Deltaproteobacteria bacterium]